MKFLNRIRCGHRDLVRLLLLLSARCWYDRALPARAQCNFLHPCSRAFRSVCIPLLMCVFDQVFVLGLSNLSSFSLHEIWLLKHLACLHLILLCRTYMILNVKQCWCYNFSELAAKFRKHVGWSKICGKRVHKLSSALWATSQARSYAWFLLRSCSAANIKPVNPQPRTSAESFDWWVGATSRDPYISLGIVSPTSCCCCWALEFCSISEVLHFADLKTGNIWFWHIFQIFLAVRSNRSVEFPDEMYFIAENMPCTCCRKHVGPFQS